jgi:hypothetical protein
MIEQGAIIGGRAATEFESYWYSFMVDDVMTGPHSSGSYVSAEAAYMAGKLSATNELRAALAKAQSDTATCCMVAGQVAKESMT